MSFDAEWARLREDWRAEPATPAATAAELRRRVRRQDLLLRLGFAAEIAGLVFAAAVGASALYRNSHPGVVAAVIIWYVLLAGSLAFAIWNRRGIWRAAGQSTRDFLELSRRRCLASIRNCQASLYIAPVTNVVFLPLLYVSLEEQAARAMLSGVIGANVGLAVAAAFVLWYRRRKRRELAELEKLLKGLAEE
jgi:tellurite resistance protein TehA-like permease